MAEAPVLTEPWPLPLQFEPAIEMTDAQFARFCALNRDLRIERTSEGYVMIMMPTGGGTGKWNARLVIDLGNWALRDGSGDVFDSSTGFRLPNGATRSPDVSWVRKERLAALTPEEQKSFLPLCPDFVIELRSSTDRLPYVQDKMEEYLATGARLGWLLDPLEKKLHVYAPGTDVQVLDEPDAVSGDPVLPGFTLDLRPFWQPPF